MNKSIKKIHFVGVKGVGVAPLAIIAKDAGIKVSGSDVADEFITDESLKKAGITPLIGFSGEYIKDVDLVITTGAHGGFDNEEVKAAKEKNIPVLTQGEAVGVFMKGEIFGKQQLGISIFGSHGKTTTTAMIATILQKAGTDPSYLIGTSDIPSLEESAHYGKGEYFIAEADEYATEPFYDKTPKLFWQHPKIAVCTNIELDHPDMYVSVDNLLEVFIQFVQNLPRDGTLIACGDDPNVQKLLQQFKGKKITYGAQNINDYQVKNIAIQGTKSSFQLYRHGVLLDTFTIAVSGEHNALNATAAIIAAKTTGISIEKIKDGIGSFRGSKRRLEYIGKLPSGAFFYDDYAHHPSEITASLKALKASYPGKKLICIFQPHTYSRTKALFDEFSTAFTPADEVILTDIYASMREQVDSSVSMANLASKVREIGKIVHYLPKPIDVVKYVQHHAFTDDTLLVTMGAGDIYKIAKELNIIYG